MRVGVLLICTFLSLHIFSQGFGSITQKKYPNVRALLVGISDYDEIQDLSYAHKDADLIYNFLLETYPSQKANFDLLKNKDASEYAIIQSVMKLIKTAQEGDLVLIYFSCHGDVVEDIIEDDQGYFLTSTASKSRVYTAGGAVKFELISKAITKLSTVKKSEVWFITDACKSGKAIDPVGARNTITALTTSFQNTTNFISCAPQELSFENDSLQYGVFTYHLVKAFSGAAQTDDRPQTLTVDEINSYLKNEVRTVTKKKQTPRVIASDEFAEIFTPMPQLANLLKVDGTGDLAASKGSDDDQKSPQLIRLEDEVIKGNFYGNSSSAETLLTQAEKSKSTDYERMKTVYIEGLMAQIQKNTNIFLNSRVQLADEANFGQLNLDLQHLKSQFTSDDLLYDDLDLRQRFFAAMEKVQTLPANELGASEAELLQLQKSFPKAAIVPQGLSMLYLKQNEHDKAKKQLLICQKLVPSWEKPKYTLVRAEIITGQINSAKDNLKKLEAANVENPDVLQLRFLLYKANLEISQADQLVNSAQGAGLNPLEKRRMNAEITALRGWNQKAIDLYIQILEKEPNDISTLTELVKLTGQNLDTVKTLKYLDKLNLLEPENVAWKKDQARLRNQPYLLPGERSFQSWGELQAYTNSLLQEGKNQEALDLLTKYEITYKQLADYLYLVGKSHYNLHQTTQAITALKGAVEANPLHFPSVQALTYIYIEQKKKVEADALLKKELTLFQNSAKFLAFAYEAYGFLNERNDQYALLEKAIKIDSLESDVLRAMYRYHLQNSSFDLAEKELKNLLACGGTSQDEALFWTTYQNQVYKQLKEKNYQGLRMPLERLVKENPMDFQMLYFKALVEYMDLDYTAANKSLSALYKYVQNLGPSSLKEYYSLKGKVLLENGNAQTAVQAFKMANEGNGQPSYLGLAMAYFELGQDWQNYFQKDYQFKDMNEDAYKRYEKMMKKMK